MEKKEVKNKLKKKIFLILFKGGGGGGGEGFDVSKAGDARVGLVGFPSGFNFPYSNISYYIYFIVLSRKINFVDKNNRNIF